MPDQELTVTVNIDTDDPEGELREFVRSIVRDELKKEARRLSHRGGLPVTLAADSGLSTSDTEGYLLEEADPGTSREE